MVGRPNVGKSSFFNRLIKGKKAIVDPLPGVTRDRHYERVEWDGREFILVDTGGIEFDSHDSMSGSIRAQTLQAVDEAEIIIFMVDGKEGLSREDYEIAGLLRKSNKPLYCAVNKIDGPEVEQQAMPQFYELGMERLWPVSAAHGYGVNSLLAALVEDLDYPVDQDDSPADSISVAFIGRPNVGKSSLINRLTGAERMVVSEIPGTTRDSVDTLLERKGKNYLLIDTAGIRRKGKVTEKIEKFSVMGALKTMERCDITLILVDALEGITEQDTKVIGYALERGRACLILINKWDLIKGDKKRQKQLGDEIKEATGFVGYAPVMPVSALTGYGVKKIFAAIEEVYTQYTLEFPTNRLNLILRKAIDGHTPPLHKGKRLKFYYATQLGSGPPAFVIFVNYPKGVHFSYNRYLTNQFRDELGLSKSPLKIILRERKRKQYG